MQLDRPVKRMHRHKNGKLCSPDEVMDPSCTQTVIHVTSVFRVSDTEICQKELTSVIKYAECE